MQSTGTLEDAFIIARYAYKVGTQILSDSSYDTLLQKLRAAGRVPEYTERLYEDDPIPHLLLKKYGLLELIPDGNKVKENLELLLDEKSYSIRPVESMSDAKVWFDKLLGKRVTFSLKVDGVNSRTIYKKKCDGEFIPVVSSSRGRETDDLLDYTASLTNKIPAKLQFDSMKDHITVYAEFYAKSSSLPYLSQKYKNLVNPRSAGVSIARVPIETEDYIHTKLKVFNVPALNSSLMVALDTAKAMGFDVVPYKSIIVDREFLDNYEYNITDILSYFGGVMIEEEIPADGVVVSVDSAISFDTSSVGIYPESSIALKFGPFSPEIYESEVILIETCIQRTYGSVVAVIKPVVTSNGNTATRVNCFSPAIAIRENLLPGNKIYFEYKSNNNINLVPRNRRTAP